MPTRRTTGTPSRGKAGGPITTRHIQSVASEIAEFAGIEAGQALKVLQALHIDKLPEQAAALSRAIDDPVTAQAFGYSESQVREIQKTLGSGLSLKNLRVGVKAPGLAVSIIV